MPCLLVAANVDILEDSYRFEVDEACGLSKKHDEEIFFRPLSSEDTTLEIHFTLFNRHFDVKTFRDL